MAAVVADTHALVWYLLESQRLSAAALAALDEAASAGDPIYLSAISVVEIVYLQERGRLTINALERLFSHVSAAGSGVEIVSLNLDLAGTVQQISRAAVPEMPDGIIAATALYLDLPLVTRDLALRSAPIRTIW